MPDPTSAAAVRDARTHAFVLAEMLARAFGEGEAAVVAVREVSFEIRAGARIAVVGPSGSGKSTLLHLIAGLDVPTSGTISWPALGTANTLRPGPIGVAFQGPSLLPPLTVLENVELPLLLMDRDPQTASREAIDLLERFGLQDVRERLPEELSGGQSQRTGLARALAGSPRLVLADEPTGQLDRATAGVVLDALLEAATESDIAVLVTTHDASVAERMDAVWTMHDGALLTEVDGSSR